MSSTKFTIENCTVELPPHQKKKINTLYYFKQVDNFALDLFHNESVLPAVDWTCLYLEAELLLGHLKGRYLCRSWSLSRAGLC